MIHEPNPARDGWPEGTLPQPPQLPEPDYTEPPIGTDLPDEPADSGWHWYEFNWEAPR
jgi:hypothetical protein